MTIATMLHASRLACALLLGVVALSADAAETARRLATAIAPQPVAGALADFARQTGLQVVYVSSIVEGARSGGAPAAMTTTDALAQLLHGTALRFQLLNARTVRIFAAPVSAPRATSSARPTSGRTNEQGATRSTVLEQVIVTATRSRLPANRVPLSMSVWTQDNLEASMVKGMSQLGVKTAGMDFSIRSTGGDFYSDLAIRGMTNRHGPTVAVYLDDTQIPPSRGTTYLQSFPLTFDLDRVEVLGGPQGMLLGDHALGGAVRFINQEPSLTTSHGHARAEVATTAGGAASYEAGASIGGPLVENVSGFRASAWFRKQGGYVDRIDPFTNATVKENSNKYGMASARAAFTLAASDSVRITSALSYQSINIYDTSSLYLDESDVGNRRLRNGSLVAQTFDDAFYLASLKLEATLGTAELTANTAYFSRDAVSMNDLSKRPVESYADAARWRVEHTMRLLSQEVRLKSIDRDDAPLGWLLGAYAAGEHGRSPERVLGDPESWNALVMDRDQVAVFAEGNLKLGKGIGASAGFRIGRTGFRSAAELQPGFKADVSETWVTPRFVLSWVADPRTLVYVTAVKGYGSAGVYPGFIFDPQAYPSDTAWSYELGARTATRDGRVEFDASVFHTRWDNGAAQDNIFFAENTPVPGPAVSDGFEVACRALLAEHTEASLAVAYTHARYVRTMQFENIVIVRDGDSVGGAPWNVIASIEQEFSLHARLSGVLRVEDSYHSRNPGPLFSDNPGSPYYNPVPGNPATNVLDLRASLSWPEYDVSAFVQNALDERPVFGYLVFGARNAQTMRPRTIGVSVSWHLH